MNKNLLALLFAVPGFGLAQTTYDVMGLAASVDQVAVTSKDDASHEVALSFTREPGWYADAKETEIGVSSTNDTKFRIIKTNTEGIYKLFCVKNNKFVAYKDANQGANKTMFVDGDTDPKTNWRIVPNLGANGNKNNFDIFPGAVTNPNNNTPAWNVFGGSQNGRGRIGYWNAGDNGSCWSIEVKSQQIKFFSSYDKSNESYFMTIRGRYVHKDGDKFSADYNLKFGDKNYLFQLVGTPSDFRIYSVATGQPIGTEPNSGLNTSDKEDNNLYRPNKESHFTAQSYNERVYVKEKRGQNIYLNFREPYLSTWHHEFAWTHRDEGSQILFTGEDGILAEAAKKLEAEIRDNCPDNKFGDELGQYSNEQKQARDLVLEGLKKAQGSTETIQKKKEFYEAAKELSGILTLNMPQDGDLLYLSFARNSNVKYLTSSLHEASENGWATYGSLGGHLTGKAAKGYDALFYVKLNAQGKATLVSVATGRRVAWGKRADNKTYPTIASKNGEGAAFTITSRDGKYVFEQEGHFLACDANGNYAEAYSNYNSTFATIRLERVTTLPFTIGPSGFSSFWSPVEYTLPAGVTASRLEVVDGKVKLSPVEGNVPKNTAVLLKGEPNATVQLTLVPNGTTAPLTGNLLMGGAEPKALTTPVYALKKSSPSFIKVGDYMPAFKAYFTASESQVRELLERGLTGVVSVVAEAEDAPVYDLSGRRVQHTTKGGVYVTNGKKFIAK